MTKFHKFTVVLAVFFFVGNGLNIFAQKENKIDKLLTKEDQEVFKKATKMEVFSIDEKTTDWVDFDKAENQVLNEKDRFHGYKIIKTRTVPEEAGRQTVNEKLWAAVGEGTISRCFLPRHGLRATFNDKTVELLICFECGQVYAFNGKGYKFESISDSLRYNLNYFLISSKN